MQNNYRYLLDTNILSELIRHPIGIVAQQLRRYDPAILCTSIIVACELRFGAKKKQSAKLAKRVDDILNNITVLPLRHEVDTQYATIRLHLEEKGTPIGPNDLLIAAHALSLGVTVVTANIDEFSRVPNLQVENWLNQ